MLDLYVLRSAAVLRPCIIPASGDFCAEKLKIFGHVLIFISVASGRLRGPNQLVAQPRPAREENVPMFHAREVWGEWTLTHRSVWAR